MYAPGYGYPFHGARNGAPGNAAAGGPPAGAAAAAGQQNHNNNAADPNGNNANNNNANGYVFNPTWGAAQQAAWAAQFGGAYVPGYGAGVPAGGGGIGGMGGGLFGGNAANNNNNMGGVGAAGGVGPIPPNFGATYGVGLGFQAMGPGAMGGGGVNGGIGGASNATGATMPQGMPPNRGRGGVMPFPMPPGVPPMGGVHPGQHMGVPPPSSSTIPAPNAATGTLGMRCWEIGRKDPEGIRMELRAVIDQAMDVNVNFDRDEYLTQVCAATVPVVYLTMNPWAPQVLPVYGLGKYNPMMGGGSSMLDDRYFALKEPCMCYQMPRLMKLEHWGRGMQRIWQHWMPFTQEVKILATSLLQQQIQLLGQSW